jgi:RNA polymerase sigma-70 factor (ECF subfamily)
MSRGPRKRRRARPSDSIPPGEALPAEDRPPPRAEPPSVYVDDRTLVREDRFIQKVLVRYGVRPQDLPDRVQEVLIVAWTAIAAGHFRPPPERPLQQGLRAWLHGIAWRQASDDRSIAHRRYEMPMGLSPDLTAVRPRTEDQITAKQLLLVFRRLPRKYQEILALVALGTELREAAAALGITKEAASARLRLGRQLFLRAIARWRRPPARRRDKPPGTQRGGT